MIPPQKQKVESSSLHFDCLNWFQESTFASYQVAALGSRDAWLTPLQSEQVPLHALWRRC